MDKESPEAFVQRWIDTLYRQAGVLNKERSEADSEINQIAAGRAHLEVMACARQMEVEWKANNYVRPTD